MRHGWAEVWLRVVTLTLVAAQPAFAERIEPPTDVGLVLGGGGARGGAHIGVLKVLERERIPVRAIAGTSMGSIVGGLYAAGYRADEIEELVNSIDWRDVFKDDPGRPDLPIRRKNDDFARLGGAEIGFGPDGLRPPRGLIQGQKLQLLLTRYLGAYGRELDFDRLALPFRSVAADIETGEAVIFADGDPAAAIRASMSVPGAFQPIRVNQRLLVDGGIVKNVPIDVARAMAGVQRLIVVEVGAPAGTADDLSSPFAVADQVITLMMKRQTQASLDMLDAEDLLIQPDLGKLSSASFDRMAEAIEAGERAALALLPQLRRYAVSAEQYAAFELRPRGIQLAGGHIEFVEIDPSRSRTAGFVADRLAALVGERLDTSLIDERIERVYGEGRYERISYEVVERDGQQGLRVLPVDKGWGPNFLRVGLAFSDDLNGESSYLLRAEARFTELSPLNTELRTRISLGEQSQVRGELIQAFGGHGEYFVATSLDYLAEELLFPFFPGGLALADYRYRRATAALELGHDTSARLRHYLRAERGVDRASLKTGARDGSLPDGVEQDYGAITLGFVADALDSYGFPSTGYRIEGEYQRMLEALGNETDSEVLRLRATGVHTLDRHRFIGVVAASTAISGEPVLRAASRIGGLGNLSGFPERALIGDGTLLFGGTYLYQMTGAQRLFALPTFIGGSVEAGRAYLGDDDYTLDGLIIAGSLMVGAETPAGPVILGFGRAESGDTSFYLRFGSLVRTLEDR